MRARASQLATVDNQILLPDRPMLKPAFQNLPGARGITSLRRQRRPRGMRRHAVMGHRPPRVILRPRLRDPDVARITGKLTTLQGTDHGVAIAYLAACRVHQVSAALHLAQKRVIET